MSRYYDDNHSVTYPGLLDVNTHRDAVLGAIEVKILFSVILVAIMIGSCFGNVITCAVIIRERSMRTPTNAYLFNLAIADLLVSLNIPLETYVLVWFPRRYPFGVIGCHVQYLLGCLGNASVLTITVFTIERYLVISRPFLRQSLSNTSRVYKIIVIIWIVAAAFSLPETALATVAEGKSYSICFTTMSVQMKVFILIEVLTLFLMPMVLICTLYVLMAMRLRNTSMRRSPVKLVKVRMLAAVAVSFFFCWSPFVVMRVLSIFPKFDSDDYYEMWRVIYYTMIVNSYLSTIVNPILYILSSRKFRHAIRDLLRGKHEKKAQLMSMYNGPSQRPLKVVENKGHVPSIALNLYLSGN